MNPTALLVFEVAIFLDLALGLVILLKDKAKFINRLFFYLSALIAVWVFTNLMVGLSADEVTALVWYRLTFVTAAPMMYALYLFCANFPKKITSSRVVALLPLIPTTFVSYISLTPLVIRDVTVGEATFSFSYSSGFPAFIIFAVVLIFSSLAFLVWQYKSSEGTTRQQVKYVLIGMGVASIFALSTDLLLPLIGVNQFANSGSLGAIGLSLAIAYSIVKYQLFNIKVLLTEAAVALVLLTMSGQALSVPREQLPPRLLLLAVLLYGGIILIRSVRDEVSRREEVEKLAKERTETLRELEQRNKNLAALQKVSKMVLNQIEMRPMVQAILDEIPKQFENCNGALLNLVHGGHMAAYAFSSNEFSKKIFSLVGTDIEKYSYPIKKGFNLLHDTLVDKQVKESTRVSDFICPPITKPIATTIQTLLGMKYTVGIPLFAGKEPLGVMMFSYRVPKEQLMDKDIDMAVAISDEMSLAIQRAYAFQQLKDANAYLADLDKLKDEFISIASHELNTPLAAVEGYLSMILDENMGKVDAKARLYLSRAYASSKRLAELILDLLNVSRIEQGRVKMKFAQANLYDLAESVMHELQVKADAKNLYLKLEADKKKIPLTWCDPDRIREVIVNLVGNSIKYSEKGGISMKISEDAGRLRFDVIDTGRGIAAEDQKKLFQKFSQVKREIDEHQGTGLGLYISKSFIELHKGRIWVESEEGKGSDFVFELPVLTEPPKDIDGAILEGPLSAPRMELRDQKTPAIVTASTKR